MATTKRHYDEPPLEEAIFELFVQPSAPWTQAQAEELAKRLPAFAGKREDLEDLAVLVRVGPGRSVAQEMNAGAKRTRLWNPEQSRAVQLGTEMCTLNVRRPYGHFEDHLDGIRALFDAYLTVMKPEKLAWVGQRYLNFARLPPDSSPSQYFEMYPHLPPELPLAHRPFAVQVETATFEQGSTVVNLALQEFTPEAAVYTIDIYARSDLSVPLDIEKLVAWQVRAHESIGKSFELTITKQARTLFKERRTPGCSSTTPRRSRSSRSSGAACAARMRSPPEFLLLDDVLELHRVQLERWGGQAGLRDARALESAIAPPQATFDGELLHPDLFTMAAAYAFHIAEAQAFRTFVNTKIRPRNSPKNGCKVDRLRSSERQLSLRLPL